MIDMKPCPFCGGTEVELYIKGTGWAKYAAVCKFCDARSGRKRDKKMALQEWNRRSDKPGTGEWISVNDRLPEDGQQVLIYVTIPGHLPIQTAMCIDGGGELWLDSGYSFGDDVTHWMDLPEPPKTEGSETK